MNLFDTPRVHPSEPVLPPAPRGFVSEVLSQLADQRDRIRWLKQVYHWNDLPVPPDEQLPAHIRAEEEAYRQAKAQAAELAAQMGYAWPPPHLRGLEVL